MNYGVRLEVWGEYACWTRPEMKAERVSYDVMTPSGTRGILEAIYWKPQMRWVIDRIRVLAPIRFANMRRNEVDLPKVAVTERMMQGQGEVPAVYIEEKRQQRAALLLTNVRYGIEAHIEVLDPQEKGGAVLAEPVAKHLDQFNRRARDGACFHRPYMGCREFPAYFSPVGAEGFSPCPPELQKERELGFMLYDMEHAGHPGSTPRPHQCDDRCQPRFFRARLVNGVVDVAACLQETREAFGQ